MLVRFSMLFQILVEETPQRVFQWWRSGDGNHFLSHRVFERDGAGVKADAAALVGTGKTVFQVTFDRTSDLCQLATDLMMASRAKFHFQQVIALSGSQQGIFEDGFFRPSFGFDCKRRICFSRGHG